jgi:hypothetical protein
MTRLLDIQVVQIDPEFQSLIPIMVKEEKDALEASILAEGCRDSLVHWDGVLLDGHNRYEICTRHEIPFKTTGKTFDNRDQAKIWVIANQLSRRNITPAQRTYLLGIQYNLEKKEATGFKDRDVSGDQNEHRQKTADKIAAQHHVSPATVKRAEKFADAVDKLSPEEKAEVLAGKSDKTKQEIIGGESQSKNLPKLGPPSFGMQFAELAIRDLEKIRDDDIERDQAFDRVRGWLNEHQ